MSVHEKLALVPLKEGIPQCVDGLWFRRTVLPQFGCEAPLTAGNKYQTLALTTRQGQTVQVAVCICYESLHSGLPQFSPAHPVDVIVHLLYDGHFASHPEWIERHLMACRSRAIETRTWSLVCSTCAGSAMIDPRGRILGRQPAAERTLRSDSLPESP
jgi:apolipoprotein N-acyltransferase